MKITKLQLKTLVMSGVLIAVFKTSNSNANNQCINIYKNNSIPTDNQQRIQSNNSLMDIVKLFQDKKPLTFIIQQSFKISAHTKSHMINILNMLTEDQKTALFRLTGLRLENNQLIEDLKVPKKTSGKAYNNMIIAISKVMIDYNNKLNSKYLDSQLNLDNLKKITEVHNDANGLIRHKNNHLNYILSKFSGLERLDSLPINLKAEMMGKISKLNLSIEGICYLAKHTGVIILPTTNSYFVIKSGAYNEHEIQYVLYKYFKITLTTKDINAASDLYAEKIKILVGEINKALDFAITNIKFYEPTDNKNLPPSSLQIENKITSFPQLLKNISESDANMISDDLKIFLEKKAPEYFELINEYYKSGNSQVLLLKLAYKAKKKGLISQSDISNTINSSLDKLTTPVNRTELSALKLDAAIHSQPSSWENLETTSVWDSDGLMKSELSINSTFINKKPNQDPKNDGTSESQLKTESQKNMTERLTEFEPFKTFSGQTLIYSIEPLDPKSFFEFIISNRQLKNIFMNKYDDFISSITRVVEMRYGRNNLLSRDGHISTKHQEIFSMYFGEVRVLVGVEKQIPSAEDPRSAIVVILAAYHKGTITDKTEEIIFNKSLEMATRKGHILSH